MSEKTIESPYKLADSHSRVGIELTVAHGVVKERILLHEKFELRPMVTGELVVPSRPSER